MGFFNHDELGKRYKVNFSNERRGIASAWAANFETFRENYPDPDFMT